MSIPPYLSSLIAEEDWFGKDGYPAAEIDISSVIGAVLPGDYASLFGPALSAASLSTSTGDNTIPFAIYSCPAIGIPPIPVTAVVLAGTPAVPFFPDPELEG